MTNPTPKSRNAALGLVSRINRWLLAGSVAATGAFALLAAHAFPGHTTRTSNGASSSAVTTQLPSDDGASTDDGTGSSLQQPSSIPSASSSSSSSGSTSSSGSVVSGGS